MIQTNPYISKNIEVETIENSNFRKVIWTGTHMQLVFMSIPVGEDIGVEVHPEVDQFFRIESGTAHIIVDDKEFDLAADGVLIIPAGAEHNVINSGTDDLKMYTIYTPPNHIDGRVHATKVDAIADFEDEEFGHRY